MRRRARSARCRRRHALFGHFGYSTQPDRAADGIVSRREMIHSLSQVLEQAAARYPEREAVRCQQQSLSYAQLQARAARLAAALAQHGVQRGERVGIYLNKSLESVVAIYGIMRAGAAYVPLDPFAPVARLRQIINDCGIRCL